MHLSLPETLYIKNRIVHDGDDVFRLSPRQFKAYSKQQPPPLAPTPHHEISPPFAGLAQLHAKLQLLLYTPLAINDASGQLRAMATEIERLVDSHSDACIASILLTPYGTYTPQHALNAAIVVLLLARALGAEASRRQSLCCAALTMNIGVVLLQDQMARQESPPSTLQQNSIRLHPVLSSALLREMGITDPCWHRAILLHHEEWNRCGYPFGLAQDEIDEDAHLLHVADLVCAKLMPRSYRQRLPARQALAQLYQNRDAQLDARVVAILVRELGFYPPGGFVSLENGQLALVIYRGDSPQTPQVAIPGTGTGCLDTSDAAFRIREGVAPRVAPRHYPMLTRLWEIHA